MSRLKGRLENIEKNLFGDDLRHISVTAFDNGLGGKITWGIPHVLTSVRYEHETKVSFFGLTVMPHELRPIMETSNNLAELRKMAEKYNCDLCVYPFSRKDPRIGLWD